MFLGTRAQQTTAVRDEIDSKRIGVNYSDKGALGLGREFERMDPDYYVGWYFEGMFKYDRAADYLGYRNCIAPLRKALFLFEKNYAGHLEQVFTTRKYGFAPSDITQIGNALYDSYSNIEEPDSAMWVLDRIQDWHISVDFMEYHIKAAWTINRNRYILHKYSFLKNSVKANENLVLKHLYTALDQGDANSIFYLALVHNYLMNIDSAAFYYNLLKQTTGFSYNNYAHFQNTLGNFAEAIQDFENDRYGYDKRLIESYYFLPTLYINSGQCLKAIRQTNSIIDANGSTPGFGWYNIALARSYLYDGQLDSCENAITKAAQFKEIHIGTTLGQSQYDFAVNSIKMMWATRMIARIKFQNRGWWHSLEDLSQISALKAQQFLLKFALVNELQDNPERQLVIYNIFASENVIGFDEILHLLGTISPAYYENLYHQKMQTEKRANIVRYMQLFYGTFAFENADYAASRRMFEKILQTTLLDTAHEKLFIARLYQSLARCYLHDNDNEMAQSMTLNFFKEYPELFPYSGLSLQMHLEEIPQTIRPQNKILSDLKDCQIDFTDQSGPYIPTAFLKFVPLKNKYEVDYEVRSPGGALIVPLQKMYFKNADGVGRELGMRLCGVGGPVEFN